MKYVYHEDLSFEFESPCRFPMMKFKFLRDYLINNKIIKLEDLGSPHDIDLHMPFYAHGSDYINNFISGTLSSKEMRRIGFPWSKPLVHRSIIALNCTYQTIESALDNGLAANLAGGTHHAFYDYGSGYCIFNDIAVACKKIRLDKPGINKILIIDLDVHQGDGTIDILKDDNDIEIMSIHCEQNFPLKKQISTYDYSLKSGTTDSEYLTLLEHFLSKKININEYDLIIYDAGVDIHKNDSLGLFNISTDGIYNRDQMVIAACIDARIPLACLIGGGYNKNLKYLSHIHSQLFLAIENNIY